MDVAGPETRRRLAGPPAAALILAFLVAGSAEAQNFPQPIFQAPFSFPNPGARSLGLGGAFIALADDATTSFANPAGLVQLLEPEVSFDVRVWDYSTRYTSGGRMSGTPTGLGIDANPGLEFGTSSESATGLSFLSYVHPMKRWSVAFHRHVQGNFKASSETQGLFSTGPTGTRRISDQRTSSDFELVTYGVSAAYKVTERLSLGVGFVHFGGALTIDATTYARDDDSVEGFFQAVSYRPDRVMISQTLSTDDTDWGVSAGLLWKASRLWSFGAVYRAAPRFEFRGSAIAGPANTLGIAPGTVLPLDELGEFAIPDGYGLGVAYRSPSGRTTVSFEWDRVEYTDALEHLELDDQEIDDANEFRIGGEYVLLETTPVTALRLGAWLDPGHVIRGNGSDPIVDALLPGGENEMHYSGGLGLAFERFQVDLGVDLSHSSDTISISAVFTL